VFQGYLNVTFKHPRALGGVLQKRDFSTNLQHEYIRVVIFFFVFPMKQGDSRECKA
jgi:hypothetical protein